MALLGVVAVAFGTIEYVNYYVVRLAYPASLWWREVRGRRRPRLMIEVDRGLASTG